MLGSVSQVSLTGISAASVALRVSANNLANALTDGFKASRTVLADQSPLANSGIGEATGGAPGSAPIGHGVQVAAIDRDHSQGALMFRDGRSELALEGNGFFVLEGSDGERLYARDGRFQFNSNSELVSHSGHRVLGTNFDRPASSSGELEPIVVPQGRMSDLSFADDGTITARLPDGHVREVAQIAITEFRNPGGLVRRGNSAYAGGINSGEASGRGQTRIVAGAREISNTDIAAELVNLSQSSALYRANLHVIDTTHELLEELMHLTR